MACFLGKPDKTGTPIDWPEFLGLGICESKSVADAVGVRFDAWVSRDF
jgi:hypothetical protein